ncbi:ScbA/BarX family gamma-butyrolactone biosynthesis protein [Streptomyces sp. NPDC005963]|uniref:ScbA/BarX family gamma-butyrolactone biosynthesis protein n=1 Tax=Streptomyces sp. NPDC005963 TaxID=3156721 RepID=UPI0033EC47CE
MSTNALHLADRTLLRIPAGQAPQDSWLADSAPIQFTTTVPKEFVHRAALAEVLLTGGERHDDTRFDVTAQWPRSHSFYSPIEGRHDPLLIAETIRQVGFLLLHTEFSVPLGYQFLLRTFTMSVQPEHLHVGHAPADLGIEVTFSDPDPRRDLGSAGRYDAVVRRDGVTVATGGLSYTCITPRAYRRLRSNQGHVHIPLTAPVQPQSVGRVFPNDVVLSPTGAENRWQLRVDTRHPVLFDHPVDHVPGMALCEAVRQAATATLGCDKILPVRMETDFSKYVELDAPCFIEAVRLPSDAQGDVVQVIGVQDGQETFRAHITAVPAAS